MTTALMCDLKLPGSERATAKKYSGIAASFRGQANGLWLWQNDVGQMIVDQLLEPEARAVAA